MLALRFKWYKSDTGMYYFINKKTRKFFIVIVYINKIFPTPLRVEVKIYNEIGMLWP